MTVRPKYTTRELRLIRELDAAILRAKTAEELVNRMVPVVEAAVAWSKQFGQVPHEGVGVASVFDIMDAVKEYLK